MATTPRCVILDDYQGVATSYADWSSLPVEVETVREHLDEEATATALAGAEIVVLMRERTPLTRDLLRRLPDLRLVVTTGMRNAAIDLEACRERGIPVCGTASSKTSTAELTWALVLGLLRQVGPGAGPWPRAAGRPPWVPTSRAGRSACSASARSGAGWPGSARPSTWTWSPGVRT